MRVDGRVDVRERLRLIECCTLRVKDIDLERLEILVRDGKGRRDRLTMLPRALLTVQPELFLVGLANHAIIATVMAGYEGHRGWVNYLAVAPECQRQGFGRSMMCEVERLLRAAGCPKVNLQVRDANIEALGFYSALGYRRDEVVSLGKRLDASRTDA